MYSIKKRHLVTIALLVLPIIAVLLPDSYTESTRLQTTRIFKIFLAGADTFSQKLQEAVSPKGFFSGHLKNLNLQIQTLKTENIRLKETLLENQRLRELLSFKDKLKYIVVPAQVIARDPANWRHSILINKGTVHGVKKNMFVISEQGLVARICETGRTLSKAILLTDPDFKVAAAGTAGREQMLVTGTGRNLCKLEYLSEAADIKVKEAVVTSGLGGFCPKGILIGEVASVSKSSDEFSLEAMLKPSASLNSLEEVFVIVEQAR